MNKKQKLVWHQASEKPEEFVVCLCRGDGYDTGAHSGYLLAFVANGQWVTGKQQSEVTVTEWAILPNPLR